MHSTHQPAEMPCPVEVDQLLTAIVRRGFTMRYCNGSQQPTLIVGTYDWGVFIDIVVIRDIDNVISARVPTAEVTDIFIPETIVWLYASDAQQALQALLELPPPQHPLAPTTRASAPLALHVPAARQAPITIRPPVADGRKTPNPSRIHDSTVAPAITNGFTLEPAGEEDCRISSGEQTAAGSPDPGMPQASQQSRIDHRLSRSGRIFTPSEPCRDLELMERVRERLHHL